LLIEAAALLTALALFSREVDEALFGLASLGCTAVFLPPSPLSTDLLDITAKRQFSPHKRFESSFRIRPSKDLYCLTDPICSKHHQPMFWNRFRD
jgi:hypothetical protein